MMEISKLAKSRQLSQDNIEIYDRNFSYEEQICSVWLIIHTMHHYILQVPVYISTLFCVYYMKKLEEGGKLFAYYMKIAWRGCKICWNKFQH